MNKVKKKLAEILPIESADMVFTFSIKEDTCVPDKYPSCRKYSELYKEFVSLGFSKEHIENLICPCWSLAALLNVIPTHIKDYNVLMIDYGENEFAIWYDEIGYGVNNDLPNITMESAVDACYEMIIHLNELKML